MTSFAHGLVLLLVSLFPPLFFFPSPHSFPLSHFPPSTSYHGQPQQRRTRGSPGARLERVPGRAHRWSESTPHSLGGNETTDHLQLMAALKLMHRSHSSFVVLLLCAIHRDTSARLLSPKTSSLTSKPWTRKLARTSHALSTRYCFKVDSRHHQA